jgi:hypothetical protein
MLICKTTADAITEFKKPKPIPHPEELLLLVIPPMMAINPTIIWKM